MNLTMEATVDLLGKSMKPLKTAYEIGLMVDAIFGMMHAAGYEPVDVMAAVSSLLATATAAATDSKENALSLIDMIYRSSLDGVEKGWDLTHPNKDSQS